LTPTLGPYLLRRISRFGAGGEYCCPSLSHMDLTHTHTHHHNTTSLSLSSFRTTSVHRSSAYGKDYITSHFAAHKERRLYDIKGSRDTKDGRTDGCHGAIPSCVQAFSLYRLHFFGQRPEVTAEQKSGLLRNIRALSLFCFKYPICTSSALFDFILWFWALWHRARKTSAEVCALEVQSQVALVSLN
jgi:hypothetical protein